VGWTIGRRLAAIGAFSIIATSAVGIISVWESTAAAAKAERAFQVNHALATTNDSQHTASVILADASMLMAPLSPTRRAEVIDQMTEHAGELREQLATLRSADIDAAFAEQMTTFAPAMTAVLDDADMLARTSGVLSASHFARVLANWDVLDEHSDATKSLLVETSAREVAAAKTVAGRARLLVLAVTLVSAVLVGVINWLVARLIATPIRATKVVLERVANGDFTGRVEARGGDDLGDMAAALNGTMQRVGQAIRQIANEAASLSDSSQRLTGVSRQVAASADRTSNQAGAASDSAAHVSTDVQAIATGADQMHTSITEIARNALAASDTMAEAVSAAEGATRTIGKLTNSSEEIGQVAKIIASIAEQTNLLALNATIEAARAGDMGKGFAVVAGEVKDLARETAKATEDIAHQIAALQADSTEAAAVIGGISIRINRVAKSQQMIAAAVEEQSASTHEITNRVAGAAGNATDIAERVAELTSSAKEATMTATETQQAAEDLAASAARLQAVVAEFRLAA
jgi:methyl-accepting chemotaxis protein